MYLFLHTKIKVSILCLALDSFLDLKKKTQTQQPPTRLNQLFEVKNECQVR